MLGLIPGVEPKVRRFERISKVLDLRLQQPRAPTISATGLEVGARTAIWEVVRTADLPVSDSSNTPHCLFDLGPSLFGQFYIILLFGPIIINNSFSPLSSVSDFRHSNDLLSFPVDPMASNRSFRAVDHAKRLNCRV
jgi:hypothetical protein